MQLDERHRNEYYCSLHGWVNKRYWQDGECAQCSVIAERKALTNRICQVVGSTDVLSAEGMRLVEQEISRLDQGENYIRALYKELHITQAMIDAAPLTMQWETMRATPEQKARAFLKVVEQLVRIRAHFPDGVRAAEWMERDDIPDDQILPWKTRVD